MNTANTVCAPSDLTWQGINWYRVIQQVKRLQARIVKATKEGRHGKVKALQWLLTHSFSGKALAVKRVTTNRGKHTPEVDNVVWKTPTAKTNAIASLKRRGYKPLPLRRIHIPKKNGKTLPLGIPTIKDRAMQALYWLALEPVAETTAGRQLLRIPAMAVNSGRGRTMFHLPRQARFRTMGTRCRYCRMLRCYQSRMADRQHSS